MKEIGPGAVSESMVVGNRCKAQKPWFRRDPGDNTTCRSETTGRNQELGSREETEAETGAYPKKNDSSWVIFS